MRWARAGARCPERAARVAAGVAGGADGDHRAASEWHGKLFQSAGAAGRGGAADDCPISLLADGAQDAQTCILMHG
jgi:hypothetical protein